MPINHITGKAIQAGFGNHFNKLIQISLGTEIIYSFIIIMCSLMIYYGTKELYELSSHKGIKYFRESFLLFALAYFARFFIKFILISLNTTHIFNVNPRIFYFGLESITIFIFMYFSSLAIFFLLYSVMWKKWKNDTNKIHIFHFLALAISFSTMLFKNPIIYLIINLILLFFVTFTLHTSKKQTKKSKHNLHFIYTLLLVFWIINIIDILIPDFFRTFQILIYLVSSGIFFTMLYKVLKKTGSN